jgi:gliding motility-associated-like protein
MQHILFLLFVPLVFLGQLSVINPSFEGTGGAGITPTPWDECMPTDEGGVLTPDLHPGLNGSIWGITLPPSDGKRYIGLAHDPNHPITESGWQEGVSQELSSPMISNGCPYVLFIDLANGWTTKNPNWGTNDPNPEDLEETIGKLKIYGGFEACSKEELLWESDPISNINWETNIAVLEPPSDNYTHILLVCESLEWEPLNQTAYILVDNMSAIVNSVPIDISTSTEEFCVGELFELEATYETDGVCSSWDDSECDRIWTASPPENVVFNNSNTNNPSVSVYEYGIYTFNYINSCAGGQSFELEITPPTVSIETPENSYCSLELQLSASSSSGSEGSWSTNSMNANVVPGFNNTATLFVNQYGSYDVEYTNCGVSDIVTIDFEPFDPYITSSSPEACENSIELSIVTTDPIIFWEQISGPAIAEIADLNAASTQVAVSEFGVYTFGVSSCDTLLTLDVAIGIPCPLEIPNTFSPNGDGINDFFQIPGLNAYTYNYSFFQVYNRWGERVYINRNYGIDGEWWNGQAVNSNTQNQISTLPVIGSNQVNDGTYYYTLELGHIIEEHPPESYFGFITVF